MTKVSIVQVIGALNRTHRSCSSHYSLRRGRGAVPASRSSGMLWWTRISMYVATMHVKVNLRHTSSEPLARDSRSATRDDSVSKVHVNS